MPLTEITADDFDVEPVMSYATAHNLTGKPVYRRKACFLHPDAADALRRAVALAAPLGLRFRIFDAFRPTDAHDLLWRSNPDPEFVADPSRGSPHSRGVAVDLTLVDTSGHTLDMGTPFDGFTPLSHHGVTDIPVAAQRNRLTLLGIMTAAGFRHYSCEWWHYQLPEATAYPLLSDAEAGTRMM
jgi:D-alanyl-D-alanine dipeptidase